MSADNTTQTTYKEDIDKYTKIDNLDEDPVVDSGKFFLVSFISPEGIMNCNTRGLKIRTHKNKVCFSSLDEARAAADEINKRDKYFHVFVGETGKWMGWDPSPDDRTKVEEEQWANKDQNEVMQSLRKREEQKLNELNALVGKKKDIINKEGKDHKKRVATAIKKAAKGEQVVDDITPQIVNEQTVKEEQEEQQKEQVKPRKVTHDPRAIKARLRKLAEEKKAADNQKEVDKYVKDSKQLQESVKETQEVKTKVDDNIKKLNDILEKAKTQNAKN